MCDAVIEKTALPYYIFCIFKDKGLIMEFNEEVTIKTDGKELLSKKDDYPALTELRQAILDAIKAKVKSIT